MYACIPKFFFGDPRHSRNGVLGNIDIRVLRLVGEGWAAVIGAQQAQIRRRWAPLVV